MATSSIFANFDIKDKETAENFVDALDKSSNVVTNDDNTNIQEIKDSNAIKLLWAKRK